ncbi:hypothetical protein ACFWA9_10125 [Kitasatospora sp. NPDC059973]|uniref:hypothetical protein n=1 Tax=Kitasatospora sp. NPDC059973 TaxID=3347020 RepID=UPI0036A78A5D
MTAGPWWERVGSEVRWYVLLGTGAPTDAPADAKLAAEIAALPFSYRHALRAIGTRLALDPVTDRPAEPSDPERVRITRLSADGDSMSIIARGASVSVVARVHRPTGAAGVVRIVRVIPGP